MINDGPGCSTDNCSIHDTLKLVTQAGELLIYVEAQSLLSYAGRLHLWVYVDFIDFIGRMISRYLSTKTGLGTLHSLPHRFVIYACQHCKLLVLFRPTAKATFRVCTAEGLGLLWLLLCCVSP